MAEFHTLADGTKFNRNGMVYTKIPAERVNCCTVLNAIEENSQQKIMVQPLENVEVVNDSQ